MFFLFVNKTKIYLLLYIFFTLITSFPIENRWIIIVLRFFKHLCLLLYYLSLSEKRDFRIILLNVLFVLVGLFLASTIYLSNTIGLIFVILSRVLLLQYSYQKLDFNSFSKKIVFYVLGLSLIIPSFIVSFYNDSDSIYMMVSLVLLLNILLFVSFLNVLSTLKKGNLTFFIAIGLFVVSDAVFGANLLGNNKDIYSIVTGSIYALGYFCINQSAIQNEKNSKKNFLI